MKMVALLVLAGALAAPAAAAAPEGFTSAPRFSEAASFVAGKPITVWCAPDVETWASYLTAHGYAGKVANGITETGSSGTMFSPVVCSSLRKKLNGVPVTNDYFAPSLLTLVHESIHARGTRDEGLTDCAAVHEMARVAVKYFGVKAGKQLRAVMAAAWSYRDRQPAAYRTVC